MIKIVNIFLPLLFFTFAFAKLYQVASVCRHGARYHVVDIYDAKDTFPLRGQLTAVGMRQCQKLGQLWRKQYIINLGFLSAKYNQSQIQVFSTPYNRTMTSAYSLLYGLYPAGTGSRLASTGRYLHFPPYSNQTNSEEQKYALPNAHSIIPVKVNERVLVCDCPNFENFSTKNFAAIPEVIQRMNKTYLPFLTRMSEMFNFSITNESFLYLTRCFDAASVDMFLGRSLPKGFTDEDYKNLMHLTNWYYYIATDRENKYMMNTLKFTRIFNTFQMRIKLLQAYTLKWTMLVGHDTDIWAIHQALNLSSYNCTEQLFVKGATNAIQCEQGAVKYASSIIIELHSDDQKNFYVKVRSNGRYMKICGKANYQCDYKEFKALIKKSMTTQDMQKLCGKRLNIINRTTESQYQSNHLEGSMLSREYHGRNKNSKKNTLIHKLLSLL